MDWLVMYLISAALLVAICFFKEGLTDGDADFIILFWTALFWPLVFVAAGAFALGRLIRRQRERAEEGQ